VSQKAVKKVAIAQTPNNTLPKLKVFLLSSLFVDYVAIVVDGLLSVIFLIIKIITFNKLINLI